MENLRGLAMIFGATVDDSTIKLGIIRIVAPEGKTWVSGDDRVIRIEWRVARRGLARGRVERRAAIEVAANRMFAGLRITSIPIETHVIRRSTINDADATRRRR